MKQQVEEGSMVRLTRWMVKTYMPGCSIYKSRPSMKGVVRRSKEEIRAEQLTLVDILAPVESFEPPTPSVEVIAQARESLQSAPLSPIPGAVTPVMPSGINPYVKEDKI